MWLPVWLVTGVTGWAIFHVNPEDSFKQISKLETQKCVEINTTKYYFNQVRDLFNHPEVWKRWFNATRRHFRFSLHFFLVHLSNAKYKYKQQKGALNVKWILICMAQHDQWMQSVWHFILSQAKQQQTKEKTFIIIKVFCLEIRQGIDWISDKTQHISLRKR